MWPHFTDSLPVPLSDAEPPGAGAAGTRSQPRILLLDDDQFMLGMQARMLRSMGYDMIGTVPTTASIAVGAILVGVWPYQVILGITAVGCVAAALSMLPARRALTVAVAPAATSPAVPAP